MGVTGVPSVSRLGYIDQLHPGVHCLGMVSVASIESLDQIAVIQRGLS